MSRTDWNRTAVRLDLPFFWLADTNGNGLPDASEVRKLAFYPSSGTSDLSAARDAILHYDATLPASLSPDEAKRRQLVLSDLDQGAPCLIATSLENASSEDRALITHMVRIAEQVDLLKATMSGAVALASRVSPDDPASQSLFRRDWGPKCAAAKTLKDPSCSAIAGAPKPVNDAYPAALQSEPDFCAKLKKHASTKQLTDPFSVVREVNGKLVSVPYTKAYPGPMNAIAEELQRAAADVQSPSEASLKAYLSAAAKSFTTNDWSLADEAWSKMSSVNSRWYVRVGPDEVLSDPCNEKAQFHLTFARIDSGSLEWQRKLTPLEAEMEKAIADAAGAPYHTRHVAFHLPDFIQIVFNAGDDRGPVGATAGQSLPNWGRVEREGRGRTVAMTNIGTDPDSLEMDRERFEALVDVDAMKGWTESPDAALLGTILHEATHNLGPTYTYQLAGVKADAAFGGAMSAMLEELKAESGALFFIGWVGKKGLATPELQHQAYTAWLDWALRHIANGVHSGSDDQAYSQLSAIQIGFLMDEGALSWSDATPAANGLDRGAFSFHDDKLVPALSKLMSRVAGIKARNDEAGASALIARYVDGTIVPQKVIAERALRFPQTTYVYAVGP